MGFMPGYCREAERYYSDALTLPIYPSMTEAQQDTVIEALGEAIAA
jgi:dTDP-4-amino-4,6-dideoxygalactose transaminase